MSRHQSQPLSSDTVCLKELVSTFSASRPFDHLEVVATLGVGGFGRVELVSPRGESTLTRKSSGSRCDSQSAARMCR